MKHIIFFYESHSDISCTRSIKNLAEFLKDSGITGFAVEKPVDQNPLLSKYDLLLYSKQIDNLQTVLNDFNNPLYKEYINQIMKVNGVSCEDKKVGFSWIYDKLLTELESNRIIKQVTEKLKCPVFSMDLSKDKILNTWDESTRMANRDEHMYQTIKANSVQEGSKILVLVGASHNNIAELFKQSQDYLVEEIFFDIQEIGISSGSDYEKQCLDKLRSRLSQTDTRHIKFTKVEDINEDIVKKIQCKLQKFFTKKLDSIIDLQDENCVYDSNSYLIEQNTFSNGNYTDPGVLKVIGCNNLENAEDDLFC